MAKPTAHYNERDRQPKGSSRIGEVSVATHVAAVTALRRWRRDRSSDMAFRQNPNRSGFRPMIIAAKTLGTYSRVSAGSARAR